MSSPYMRPSAATLRETAAQAQSDAEIAAITESDPSRDMIAADYGQAARATLTAARDLPSDVKQQLAAHLDKLAAIRTAGTQLARGIPTPRLSTEMAGPYARPQHDYTRASAVLDGAEQTVAQTQRELTAEAAAITRQAWGAALPGAPDRAMSGRVDAGVTAVHAAIGAGQKPADILQRAIAAGDETLVYSMLGTVEGKTLLTAIGADHLALAKTYGEHLLSTGRTFPGADFLAAQSDPSRSLAALRAKALAVYQAQRDRAGAILRTRAARGSSRA